MKTYSLLIGSLCLLSLTGIAQTPGKKRPISPKDMYRLQTVSDPQVSPDGKWISYGLSTVDTTKDKRNSDLWMVSWDGKETVQLTNSPDGESRARFSPDGKYLSFVSARQGATKGQIWLMDRRGGEAKKLTDLKTDLEDYDWSPDGKKIALVLRDPDYADSAKTKVRKPYVLDRYHFKADIKGYLERSPVHLYVFDLATKKLDTLTTGAYDETSPVWSPDGQYLAFVSNRTEDPDRNENTDIYVIAAQKGAQMKQLTTWTGSDNNPAWSPDGKRIAYLRSTSSSNFIMYDQPVLCVVARDGGEPTLLSKSLDRPVRTPIWAKDGQSIGVIVQDDRQAYIGQYTLDGKFSKVTSGNRVFSNLSASTAGNWVTLMSEPQVPGEVYAIESGNSRRLTHVHDAFLEPLELATVEGYTSKSKDGTQVSNVLYRPANTPAGKKLPTIFYIHGGPVSQDEFSFDLTRQLLAAGGYAVVAVNYRGSNGRGIDFTKAIYADWGNKEVQDILGAADYLVEKGIADPDRLGIGGWSYGGILTNYTIATDTRFKAAASGAGSSLQLSMYGIDQYTNQYENELGAPWKNPEKWLKLSYPFLKADRIKTPTLFMAGEKDFNVPAAGSEQMFQALRSLGIPTQLIIYPGQFHGITVPSYQKDRVDRYLQWFDKYLKPKNL
ncbi:MULTISPECIES: S9 family peptidase [unclassified Spirosoma]|uniref:S9 family peptidase n=1 Tax=unclassified Spirosoma TaxID=2621999 RepID=UPI000965735B|nr:MULTISPECIES: S9 family peptidase [unclassified Spirosoma]MBN8822965.1 S9 family peptidase [Spirosoma sp.]OJW73072.1 MAG: peptidase S9 family protein [Spirosoma sp. 48-14]